MNLIAHYDPEIDAIGLHFNQPTCGGFEVADNWSIILHVPEDESRCAAALEVIGISSWLPLGKRAYSKETDTLTFGNGTETATVIAENGDLIAYWRPDNYDPSYLTAIAVDLRNASKNLAPVIEAMSKTSHVASD